MSAVQAEVPVGGQVSVGGQGAGGALPPRLHADRLTELVELYVAAGLTDGDLGALRPLRLLRDRVELLLAEHARLAHDADGARWADVADALGVSEQTMSRWGRLLRDSRPAGSTPRAADRHRH